ncbi:MAG: ACP S-malonyltransferase, partial [Nannocystaceae bacterium]
GGDVEIVNLNSPRQNVIAGTEDAVKQAMAILEDECYVNPVVIEKQVPMHASMFSPVSQTYRQALEQAKFTPPRRPYLPNRLGKVLADPTRDQFVDLLATHVAAPVLWRQSIDHVVEISPDAVFVEVGAKQVLCNLMRRKWHKNPQFATDSREETGAHFEGVVRELRELLKLSVAPREGAGGAPCTRS